MAQGGCGAEEIEGGNGGRAISERAGSPLR